MPNWSYCRFEVECDPGEELHVQQFLHEDPWFGDSRKGVGVVRALSGDVNQMSPICFERLMPSPDVPNRMDWRVDNWGTKWDAVDGELVSCGKGLVTYAFSTAWSPPKGWLNFLSQKQPSWKMTLAFVDEGLLFAGVLHASGGEVTETLFCDRQKERLAEYGLAEYWWEEEGYEFLEEFCGDNEFANFAINA